MELIETLDTEFLREGQLSLSGESIAIAEQLGRWARILSVIVAIALFLFVLVTLVFLYILFNLNRFQSDSVTGFAVFYALFAIANLMIIFPGIYFFRIYKHTSLALLQMDNMAMSKGLEQIKSLFKYTGVAGIVLLVVFSLFYVVMFIGAFMK